MLAPWFRSVLAALALTLLAGERGEVSLERVRKARSQQILETEIQDTVEASGFAENTADDPQCPDYEVLRTVLLKLGVPPGNLTGKPCTWKGVRCAACSVTAIRHNSLTGPLPNELSNLTELDTIDFTGGNVSGTLEPFKRLKKLTRLFLGNTLVSGTLQPLAALARLESLYLSSTHVSGSLEPLKRLMFLLVLQLDHTHVHGDIYLLGFKRQMKYVDLSYTNVSGDISYFWHGMLDGPVNVHFVDLSFTQVHGRFDTSSAKLKQLHSLNLAGTLAKVFPKRYVIEEDFVNFYIPKSLATLDVSYCAQDIPVMRLITFLKMSATLARLSAKATKVSGELRLKPGFYSGKALQVLDLSKNRIQFVKQITGVGVVSLADNECPLTFGTGVIANVLKEGIELDLTNVSITNSDEVADLLTSGRLQTTPMPTFTDSERGFKCYDLQDSTLRVTPALFHPDLCGCVPGWRGSGTDCVKCEPGTFNPDFNQTICLSCPTNSTTEAGATSAQSCRCSEGRIAKDGESYRCMCELGQALHRNACADCNDLHLDCPQGSKAETALTQVGFARLRPEAPNAFRCLDPAEERCNASEGSVLGCATGYEGPLCIACADGFRSSGRRCSECLTATLSTHWVAFGVAAAALVAAGAGAASISYSRSPQQPAVESANMSRPSIREVLQPLVLAQASVLLQLVQLWGILVALNPQKGQGREGEQPALWEQEYVQWLQLTACGFRDAMSLECSYGRAARSASALLAPVFPLLLLSLCGFLEVSAPGAGVSMAVKILAVFFIGGASSCASLMSCREFDGGGEPLGPFAFRTELPHYTCAATFGEAGMADGIGLTCAIIYGVVIPAFLAYLMLKQHLVLAPSKRCMACSAIEGDRLKVWIRPFHKSAKIPLEGELAEKYVLAAGIAHSTVFFKGVVSMQMQDECLTLKLAKDPSDQDAARFDVNSAIWNVLQGKGDTDLRGCQAITRLLFERCLLESAAKSDRILAGSKELFFKYAACQDVWFEIALKLIVVALVSVASTASNTSLRMTLGFTVSTAIALATLQPYRQRQINDLQCFCFLCLSLAAIGFGYGRLHLARGAIAAPFALALLQSLRPDGQEDLSLRLFKAAEARLPALQRGEPMELVVATRSLGLI